MSCGCGRTYSSCGSCGGCSSCCGCTWQLPSLQTPGAGAGGLSLADILIQVKKQVDAQVSNAVGGLQQQVQAAVTGMTFAENVLSIAAAPPANPTVDDVHIVAGKATGAWAGHDNDLARWDGTGWVFVAPVNGESRLVDATNSLWHWNGASWVKVGTIGAPSARDLLIVATDADRPGNPRDGQMVFNQARKTIDVWDSATARWTSVGDIPVYGTVAALPSWMLEGDVAYVQADKSLYVMVQGANPGDLVWQKA